MLTLYYHAGACSLAPHIALEWIGEPYETKAVEFGDKEYLKINPAGAVPALDTGEGWILTQAAAVLRYLADRFPQAGIAPDGSPREEAEADRWASFITGDLHPAFFPLFSTNRYTRAREKEAFDNVREAAKALVRKKFDISKRILRVAATWSATSAAISTPMFFRWSAGARRCWRTGCRNTQMFRNTTT